MLGFAYVIFFQIYVNKAHLSSVSWGCLGSVQVHFSAASPGQAMAGEEKGQLQDALVQGGEIRGRMAGVLTRTWAQINVLPVHSGLVIHPSPTMDMLLVWRLRWLYPREPMGGSKAVNTLLCLLPALCV